MTEAQARMNSANADLRETIARIYQTFAPYPIPSSLDAPSYLEPGQILKNLSSAPLQQLSAGSLGPYASSALTTVGDVADYKHFLPRIMHLACLGGHGQPGMNSELIASKLSYAGWRTWPTGEQDAIERVFDRAWARSRLFHPDWEEADGWLCGNAMIGNSLDDGLKAWVAEPTPDSMVQLAHIVIGAQDIAKATGFWGEVPLEVRRRLVDWLSSEAVEAALIEAVSHVAESDLWRFDSIDAGISLLKSASWRG
jgi:hypothetical protein